MDNYQFSNKLPVKYLNYHIMPLPYPKLTDNYSYFGAL